MKSIYLRASFWVGGCFWWGAWLTFGDSLDWMSDRRQFDEQKEPQWWRFPSAEYAIYLLSRSQMRFQWFKLNVSRFFGRFNARLFCPAKQEMLIVMTSFRSNFFYSLWFPFEMTSCSLQSIQFQMKNQIKKYRNFQQLRYSFRYCLSQSTRRTFIKIHLNLIEIKLPVERVEYFPTLRIQRRLKKFKHPFQASIAWF